MTSAIIGVECEYDGEKRTQITNLSQYCHNIAIFACYNEFSSQQANKTRGV